MDKLGIFHANQTSMCFDPHKSEGLGWYCETSFSPPVIFLLTIPRRFSFVSFCASLLLCVFVFGILSCLFLATYLNKVFYTINFVEFSKFYHHHSELIVKYNICLNNLLQQGI